MYKTFQRSIRRRKQSLIATLTIKDEN